MHQPLVTTLALLAASASVTTAFSSSTLFQEQISQQKLAPSKTEGVDIELPDFDELFGRIEHVSPLARTVIRKLETGEEKGFAASSKRKLISRSELRFRKIPYPFWLIHSRG